MNSFLLLHVSFNLYIELLVNFQRQILEQKYKRSSDLLNFCGVSKRHSHLSATLISTFVSAQVNIKHSMLSSNVWYEDATCPKPDQKAYLLVYVLDHPELHFVFAFLLPVLYVNYAD